MERPLNALLFGATGLIGTHLLHQALALPGIAHVTAVSRRPMPVRSPKMTNLVASDGASLPGYDWPQTPDVAFCCLGTTIRAAGSREAFRAVDHDLVLHGAEWARRTGVAHFLLVTAIGADPRSPAFYSRVKGEVEQAVAALGFERFSVFRPSLLLGERDEHRTGEAVFGRMMPWFSPLMAGPLAPYRAVDAADVARAMLATALLPEGPRNARLHWPDMMAAIARLDALHVPPTHRRTP